MGRSLGYFLPEKLQVQWEGPTGKYFTFKDKRQLGGTHTACPPSVHKDLGVLPTTGGREGPCSCCGRCTLEGGVGTASGVASLIPALLWLPLTSAFGSVSP